MVDSKAAWVHSRDEWSDGKSTRGSYAVKLPDGRIQRVTFTADEDGFHPIITYEHADGEGNGGGGGGGGFGAIPDWIGASRGNWYTAPHEAIGGSTDIRNLGHPEEKLEESGEGVILHPHSHDLLGPTPLFHPFYDPQLLNEENISPYNPSYVYEYQYQPPLAQPHSHLHKTPVSDESSEEDGDHFEVYPNSKMNTFKPKPVIYVRGKPKPMYLAHGRKDLDGKQSMDFDEQSYKKKTNDTRLLVNNHKKEKKKKYLGDEVEESNEYTMEKSDRHDMKDLDNEKMKNEKLEAEIDREMEKTATRKYGKIHNMSAQHKDMDEYLRKIKRVMARFERPKPPYHNRHQALYRQDTTRMVTPRKWIPKKPSAEDTSENDCSELEGQPRQIDVKMTPPDKQFYTHGKMNVKRTRPNKSFYKSSKMNVKLIPPDKPFSKPFKMDVKMTPPDKPFHTPNKKEFRMTPLNKPSLKPVVNVLHNPPTMSVRMTPPDKPFHIEKHRPSLPLPSLQKKPQKGVKDFILNTFAPMLHAPPPLPPPSRKFIFNPPGHNPV